MPHLCRPFGLILLAALAAALAACNNSSTTFTPGPIATPDQSVVSLQSKVNNIIVIYQENQSFDGLYSKFPGANGSNGPTNQVYCNNGGTTYSPLQTIPSSYQSAPSANGCTWNASQSGTVVDPMIKSNGLSAGNTYNLTTFVQPSYVTGDIIHRFWHEQLQIDNAVLEPPGQFGAYSNDKITTWSDNQGLTLSYFDATNLPEGQLASQFTMFDNFFQSAYGGSFLNHQWLVCACTPVFTGTFAPSNVSSYDPVAKVLNDGQLTYMPIGGSGTLYAVNTSQPFDAPAGGGLVVPALTNKTIGDLMTDNNPSISWKWYAGGWNQALANPSSIVYTAPLQFQPHHQAFNYYQRWGTAGTTKGANLTDETTFFSDLTNGTLPQVAFVKPVGQQNEHPGYTDVLSGQTHVQALVQAIQASKYWLNSVIIITYDEFGGRWDHVSPPVTKDGWGPGSRIPAIVISPFARRGFVDHTQYETVSILKFIETRFNLPNLTARDAAAGNLLDAFDFRQTMSVQRRR